MMLLWRRMSLLEFNFISNCSPLVMRGGRLPNKGRYGCAASAKPRPGKISSKNLMPRQKKWPNT